VTVALRFTMAPADQQAVLDLPWDMPLEEWPAAYLVALPRGISRHVVRFTRIDRRIYALKEIVEATAAREYRLLRDLERLGLPAVEAVGVVTGRTAPGGAPLDPVLVTRHLQWSLPYRAVFSGTLRTDTSERLLDALVALLARLHLSGFFWGDCSLSNVLFRRDAQAFAAYLVDAETGELFASISDGQRRHDLELVHTNIAGELFDLQAGGLLDEQLDPILIAGEITRRYDALWGELTGTEQFDISERWRIARRVERLNDLGFDVEEIEIVTDLTGRTLRIQPKVVEAGFHSRRLFRLTGIDAEDQQARRLLNDLDAYVQANAGYGQSEEVIAHRWVTDCFEPVLQAVPRELRGKLEPPQIFHEVMEHRWYLSQRYDRQVSIDEAANAFATEVLPSKPDEAAVLGRAVRATDGGRVAVDDLEATQPFRLPWDG
jgi:hypothetical protein